MSILLTEMHIAESYAQYVPKDSLATDMKNQDSLKKYIAAILLENNTTEQTFKESIKYYTAHPELMDSVYQQVLSNIAVWQTRISKR